MRRQSPFDFKNASRASSMSLSAFLREHTPLRSILFPSSTEYWTRKRSIPRSKSLCRSSMSLKASVVSATPGLGVGQPTIRSFSTPFFSS
jgi:hypothetical protein